MTIQEKILALPYVSAVSDERTFGDGIWVYYRNGYKSAMDLKGALHQDHEDTWAELYRAAKDAIPCFCGHGCPTEE